MTKIDSFLEATAQHLYRCEVRYLLAMKRDNPTKLKTHLDAIGKKRGDEAKERLIDECRIQWQKGNRGDAGDWR